mgnify:CR=1 FL=1
MKGLGIFLIVIGAMMYLTGVCWAGIASLLSDSPPDLPMAITASITTFGGVLATHLGAVFDGAPELRRQPLNSQFLAQPPDRRGVLYAEPADRRGRSQVRRRLDQSADFQQGPAVVDSAPFRSTARSFCAGHYSRSLVLKVACFQTNCPDQLKLPRDFN